MVQTSLAVAAVRVRPEHLLEQAGRLQQVQGGNQRAGLITYGLDGFRPRRSTASTSSRTLYRGVGPPYTVTVEGRTR